MRRKGKRQSGNPAKRAQEQKAASEKAPAANPFGLPGKDRSGRLDLTEPPDLSALIRKINQPSKG